MKSHAPSGFTLIELLTVIAIIAILAGITAGALPGVIERARITDIKADWNAIQKGLTAYYTEHNTYPPGYGFRTWTSREHQPAITSSWQVIEDPYTDSEGNQIAWNDRSSEIMYNFIPYTVAIDIQGSEDLYDFYSPGADTDQNGYLSAMEFYPTAAFVNNPAGLFMPWANQNTNQDTESLPETPYIYAPVNLEIFRRLEGAIQVNPDFTYENANGPYYGWYGDRWPDEVMSGNQYMGQYVRDVVAPRYDAYVLISAGPQQNTAGLACPGQFALGDDPEGAEQAFLNSIHPTVRESYVKESPYQALALRTYYLATRDANDNGEPDFAYQSRRQGESRELGTDSEGNELYVLPDGSRGYGPLIFHQEG